MYSKDAEKPSRYNNEGKHTINQWKRLVHLSRQKYTIHPLILFPLRVFKTRFYNITFENILALLALMSLKND